MLEICVELRPLFRGALQLANLVVESLNLGERRIDAGIFSRRLVERIRGLFQSQLLVAQMGDAASGKQQFADLALPAHHILAAFSEARMVDTENR
nr:hypothetical protein [Lacipirellula parvula]